MIPFASQRAYGQDLATHLLNEHDNEYVEFAGLRGSIADDLHGAFAEWEAQATSLTKCKNYLYSLSINPDPKQGELTREQYMDYLDRVEVRLGLSKQGRAVVFHIKKSTETGEHREHCHAIYSRIDTANDKAVHMAFDHDKLMQVTREFSRVHGLQLPEGYSKAKGQHEGTGQLLLHEKNLQETTGFTLAERMAFVTSLWHRSDNANAFVAGLQENGYVLCTGRRSYVLVDYYGHMSALPRLIDDREVRTNNIREVLGNDYPTDNLPDVDETRKLIGKHRKESEQFEKTELEFHKREQLKLAHQLRRRELEERAAFLKQIHKEEQVTIGTSHFNERSELRARYLSGEKKIAIEREDQKPTGLSAFLAKASGFDVLQAKIHRYQHSKRFSSYEKLKVELNWHQQAQFQETLTLQELSKVDVYRRLNAISAIEKRELRSHEATNLKEIRIEQRRGLLHMPPLNLELTPKGRRPMIYKAKQRYASDLSRQIRAHDRNQEQLAGDVGASNKFQQVSPVNEKSEHPHQILKDAVSKSPFRDRLGGYDKGRKR